MPSPPRNVFAATALLVLLIPATASAAVPKKHQPRAAGLRTATFLKQLRLATQPTGLAVNSTTQSAITISWRAAKVKQRYNVYLGGSLRGSTAATTYTFSGLLCGKSYTVGVGSTGAKSAQLSMVVPTAACTGAAAPPVDLQPLSVPNGLSVTAAAASSI